MLDLNKLRERRNAIATECNAIIERSAKEGRALTADEKTRFAALETENGDLRDTIERAERLAGTQAELAKFQPVVSPKVDLSAKDKARYSILRAVRMRLENKPLDGLEGEVNEEITRQTGRAPTGFWFPSTSLNFGSAKGQEISRAFDTSGGSKLVTQRWESDYIDYLRNRSVLAQVGARYLSDLVGLVNIPVKSATTAAYWVAEGAAPTASAPTVNSQRQLTPKTVGAYCDVTRSLVNQTSYDAEAMVRDDLAATVGLAIDSAAINGTGSSNQPTGILATSGIGSIAMGTNGGALDWQAIVNFESTVAAANADQGRMAYLTNSKVRGKLKQTAKIGSTFPSFIWEQDGTINGYKAAISNAIASNGTKGDGTALSTMLFGNFDDLVIGLWGALDVTIDPYSLSTSGGLRLVALQNVDVTVRNAASFVACTDIVTA
jgi:HK97 family phage major capsid protein